MRALHQKVNFYTCILTCCSVVAACFNFKEYWMIKVGSGICSFIIIHIVYFVVVYFIA